MAWAERALRIIPFDRLNYTAYHAVAFGHFMGGRYDVAEHAARRAVQSNPTLSISEQSAGGGSRQARARRGSQNGRAASAGTGPRI